jgi:TBC domain-containing protein kinase-like protein
MASPQAHYRLKRILKAWVLSNSNLVYWQGLDSLSAPFLYLNFNNEALAYGCLTNFINKYATNFFLRDNSHVIQEYLAVFSQLIAFHDAELAVHFDSIDFKPDLYAIPWFLTMFAHVFPLQKIFHLWDTLLLGSSSFPLCIGAAILKQLRSLLMNSDFNECILLFSELPEINIVKCVSDSIELFCWTPSSCLYRYHSSHVSPNDKTTVDDSELDLCSVEIEQMRIQLCPRISPRDVLKLCDSKSSKLILIDIRPSNEYQKCFIENSKNIPFENIQINKLFQLYSSQINTANENDSTNYLIYLLQQNKSQLKILLGSRDQLDKCTQLANSLVKLKISKVCLIDKGIECFKSTKIYFEN